MNILINAAYLLGLILFTRKIIKNPIAGLWFWMIFIVYYELINPEMDNSTVIMGVNITLLDIVFVYFSIIAFQRYNEFVLLLRQDNTLNLFFLSLLFIAVAIPLFVVFQGDPVMRSINGARDFLIYIPAFLYFFSFRYSPEEMDKLVNHLLIISLVSAVVAFYMVIKTGERVVPSSGALFLAFAGLLALVKYYEKSIASYLLVAIFLLLVVVVLRHRSVWIAAGLGVLFIHFYVKVNIRVISLLFCLPVLIFLFAMFFPTTYKKFSAIVKESATALTSREEFDESTGGGRVARWEAQIEQKWNWKIPLWGNGHAYDRNVYFRVRPGDKRLSTVSFHNHYLEQMFRVGIPTVLILLLFCFKFLRLNHARQLIQKDYLMIGLSACLAGSLGFGMMYSFSYLTFIIMGIGYSILINENEDRYRNPNIQPSHRGKKLALDAWKLEEANRN